MSAQINACLWHDKAWLNSFIYSDVTTLVLHDDPYLWQGLITLLFGACSICNDLSYDVHSGFLVF